MRLTPLDIRKQAFRKIMRGFDPVEVEAFLEMVADEYESVLKGRKELIEKIGKLEKRVAEVDRMEEQLQNALMDAQKTSTASQAHSKKESDLIIREAELKAGKILEDSRRELANMKNELNLLKYQKTSFIARLKQLLRSQIDLIQVLEMDEKEIDSLRKPAKRSRRPVQDLGKPAGSMPGKDAVIRQKTAPKADQEAPSKEDSTLKDSPFAVVGGQTSGFDQAEEKSDVIDQLLDEDKQDDRSDTSESSSS